MWDELTHTLRDVYDDASSRFEITELGIWNPTPIDVIVATLKHLDQLTVLPVRVVDAGAGDGRWVCALALWAKLKGLELECVGVEGDQALLERGLKQLEALSLPDARMLHGDYLSPEPFDPLGWSLEHADLILNYPDGQEQALAQALERARSSAKLWIISPELQVRLPALSLGARVALKRAQAPAWHLSCFELQQP